MDKIAYTPPEFAAFFGKERTWAYRQLYKGKVHAITDLGRTLIPKSEVDRLLKEAGRYLGSGAKVRKSKTAVEHSNASAGAKTWAEVVKQRKKPTTADRDAAGKGQTSTGGTTARRLAYQRLTGLKKTSKLK